MEADADDEGPFLVSGRGKCPWCSSGVELRHPKRSALGAMLGSVAQDARGDFWTVSICPLCGQPILCGERGQFLPHPQPDPVAEEVPESVSSAVWEMRLCLSVGAFQGATAMGRRAIEAAALELHIEGGDLRNKIDALHAAGHITVSLKETAHAIRDFGNDGVHPKNRRVSKEDADDVSQFVDALMDALFIGPKRTAAARARRKAPTGPK